MFNPPVGPTVNFRYNRKEKKENYIDEKRKGKEKGKGSIVKDFFYYNFHKFKE